MSVVAEDQGLATAPHAAAERPHRPALILSAAAALCLVGAGLLLWWRYGDAVFSDTVLAALAWCF